MFSRISHNWTLKLTALILAVVLWSHVRGQVNPWETATFKARLRADVPRGFMMLNAEELPKTVMVTLRGPRLTLRSLKGLAPANPLATTEDAPLLSAAQLRASLDFSGSRKGAQNVPIQVSADIEDVEVVGSKPGEFAVTLDATETRRFRIQSQIPEGEELEIEDVHLSVNRAVVSGPSNLLDRIQSLRARVRRSELKAGVLRLERVPIEALDQDGEVLRGVPIEPAFVRLEIKSREKQSEKSVRVIAKINGAPDTNFELGTIEVEPSRITIKGTRRALDGVQTLSAEVGVSGARANINRLVRVNLPGGVDAVPSNRVRVRIEIKLHEPSTPSLSPRLIPAPDSPVPAPEAVG